MINKSNAYPFTLFGFHFLIWRKQKDKKSLPSGGIVKGSCKLVRHKDYIALALPDGTVIPHQIELYLEANINEVATATIKCFVTIDSQL